jgi:hypothetical protein
MVNIDKPINEKEALSAADIGQILGCSRQAVDKMAKKGGWPTIWEGRAKLFPVAGLPKDVSVRIAAKSCPYTPPAITPAQEEGLAAAMTLDGKMKLRADARASIVVLYQSFAAKAGLADTPCREAFAARWAAGEIEADPIVRAALPSFSANSLKNWLDAVRKKGVIALAGRYGRHRKGAGLIDSNPEMRETVQGMIYEYPHASTQLIRERLESISLGAGACPVVAPPSGLGVGMKAENSHVWEFIKAPTPGAGASWPRWAAPTSWSPPEPAMGIRLHPGGPATVRR